MDNWLAGIENQEQGQSDPNCSWLNIANEIFSIMCINLRSEILEISLTYIPDTSCSSKCDLTQYDENISQFGLVYF
jgi:hypothetical protein